MKTTGTPEQRKAGGRIFRWPLLLGVLTAVGLVVALVGDDIWDALSWLTLTTPIAAALWGIVRPQP